MSSHLFFRLNEANIASRIAVISFDSDVNTNLALSFSSSVSGYGDISQALDRQTGDGTGGTSTMIQDSVTCFGVVQYQFDAQCQQILNFET